MAAAGGKTAVMAQLIGHGADVNASDTSWVGPVINTAILSGNGDAVKLLLERGAKLNRLILPNRLPPLDLAAQYSDITMFEIVLAAGRESLGSDEYGGALVSACTSGRIEVVTQLIEFQPNRVHFQASLDRAYPEKNWDVVELLLQKFKAWTATMPSSQPQLMSNTGRTCSLSCGTIHRALLTRQSSTSACTKPQTAKRKPRSRRC